MTWTISAAFSDLHAARSTAAALRAHGYRVTLGHQQPAAPHTGVCPGSGTPVHTRFENAALRPSASGAVLTVLVTNETAKTAADILRAGGGRTFH